MLPAARATLMAALDTGWADPRRLYAEGRSARALLDQAREVLAQGLGARPAEVSFLPSGPAALRAPGPAEPGRYDPRRTAVAGPPSLCPGRPSGLLGRRAASARSRRRAGREAGAPTHRQLGVVPRPDASPLLTPRKRDAPVRFRPWLVTDSGRYTPCLGTTALRSL